MALKGSLIEFTNRDNLSYLFNIWMTAAPIVSTWGRNFSTNIYPAVPKIWTNVSVLKETQSPPAWANHCIRQSNSFAGLRAGFSPATNRQHPTGAFPAPKVCFSTTVCALQESLSGFDIYRPIVSIHASHDSLQVMRGWHGHRLAELRPPPSVSLNSRKGWGHNLWPHWERVRMHWSNNHEIDKVKTP